MKNDWLDAILSKFHAQMNETHISLIDKPYEEAKADILKHFKELPSMQMEEGADVLRLQPTTALFERNQLRHQLLKDMGGDDVVL